MSDQSEAFDAGENADERPGDLPDILVLVDDEAAFDFAVATDETGGEARAVGNLPDIIVLDISEEDEPHEDRLPVATTRDEETGGDNGFGQTDAGELF